MTWLKAEIGTQIPRQQHRLKPGIRSTKSLLLVTQRGLRTNKEKRVGKTQGINIKIEKRVSVQQKTELNKRFLIQKSTRSAK